MGENPVKRNKKETHSKIFYGLRILFWIQKFEVCGSSPSRPLDVKRFL